MKRIRGFEIVSYLEEKGPILPKRATKFSAGYDFFTLEDILIPARKEGVPHKPILIPTGVKAYMQGDEYLKLVSRSSSPIKKGLVVTNGVGIIDRDYYNNKDNEGHIFFQVMNISDKDVLVKKGEAIGQGIFESYLLADRDDAEGEREGGHGSTEEKDLA